MCVCVCIHINTKCKCMCPNSNGSRTHVEIPAKEPIVDDNFFSIVPGLNFTMCDFHSN